MSKTKNEKTNPPKAQEDEDTSQKPVKTKPVGKTFAQRGVEVQK